MDKDTIQIIIVEDDKALQEMYKTSIEDFNIESESYKIASCHLPNDKELPQILYDKHIDAIIIDLDWGTGSQGNEGNRLVKKIYQDCRVPIFVVSGNLQSLDDDYPQSPIFKKYQRDEIDVHKLLNEIADLYGTGYTKTLGNQSEIDNMLRKVFWEHMSSTITSWKDQEHNTKTQRMLRFAITRINEMLTVNTDSEHDNYDALEFYIKPPIKDKPFTGDIITYDDKKYIVITAACDMEQDKCDYVVLCQIDISLFTDLKDRIKNESTSKKAEDQLTTYVNNAKPRYHLLPPCHLFCGGFVDFQTIMSVSKSDFYEKSSVLASINPVFHKDIQARFSHYYGRQGQPQLNKENIINWMKQN